MNSDGSAGLKDRLLSWARELGDGWWTAEHAAAALGPDEDDVRAALAALEERGYVYRAVALADSWRITADAVEGTKEGKRRGDNGDDREA